MGTPVLGEKMTWKWIGQLISGLVLLYGLTCLLFSIIASVNGRFMHILPFQHFSHIQRIITLLALSLFSLVLFCLLEGKIMFRHRRD